MADKRKIIRSRKLFDPSFHSYSHGMRVGDLIFVSGQMAFVRERGKDNRRLVGKGDITMQARQVFKNLRDVLAAAGASLADIAAMTVYLKDIKDLDRFCQVRKEFFKHDPPASTSVQVSAFADPDGLVEVNAIAVLS